MGNGEERRAVIAVDLGGTKAACAVFGADGQALVRSAAPLAGRVGGEVGKLIAAKVREAAADARRRSLQVAAVGVAVPGIYRAGSGSVWAPNIPGWDDYPLRAELAAVVGDEVQVRIDSDRACSILGERWRGAAKGCRDAIFVAVGTGIGAGILVDGRVLRGHGDIAGAIGWLALDRPYRLEYAPVGCFEYHASGPGIVNVARELLARDPGYDGPLRRKPDAELRAEDLFGAYDAGDPVAAAVLESATEFWGMAAANLVSLFNPEKIVFGGGVFGPAARFLDRIREEAEKWAQPIAVRQVAFETSALGGDAGLYGAGWLALEAAGMAIHL